MYIIKYNYNNLYSLIDLLINKIMQYNKKYYINYDKLDYLLKMIYNEFI